MFRPTRRHVHRLTCSHAVYVADTIYRPDDEISTPATHKQYLVSYNFVKPDDGLRVGRNMSFH